jgi:hypothetical protein
MKAFESYPKPVKIFNIEIKVVDPAYIQFDTIFIFNESWSHINSGFNPSTNSNEYKQWSQYPMAPAGLLVACRAWNSSSYWRSMTLIEFLQKLGFNACLSD